MTKIQKCLAYKVMFGNTDIPHSFFWYQTGVLRLTPLGGERHEIAKIQHTVVSSGLYGINHDGVRDNGSCRQ